jgi:hypothetical protein
MSMSAGAGTEQQYDIFISYAREDLGWVKTNLHERLLTCRTAEGAPPRVFLDVSDEGIPPGQNYLDVLASALQRSRHIVLVYSTVYFTKPMCDWELSLACQLDPSGSGKLVPVLIEAEAAAHVPYKVSLHQWLSTERPDWFDRLTASVELTVDETPPALSFRTRPDDSVVNHTLPEVQVAILDASSESVLARDDPVTIGAEGGELQGTLTIEAEAGLATFRDLSLATAAPQVRLVAEAPGCTPAVSEPFAVAEPPAQPAAESPGSEPGGARRIATRGTVPVFFADGESLAVLGDETLEVFRRDGARAGEAEFGGRVRLAARAGDYLAFADWSGRVALAHRDGRIRSASLGTDPRVLTVPGGLCLGADEAYVGFWNGAVWSVPLEGEPERRFEHAPGIQALQIAGDRWVIAGLDGRLTIVGPGDAASAHELPGPLLALRAWPDCVVAVGEDAAYRVGLDSGRLVQEALPVARVVDAIADSELAVVVDSAGRGVSFDRQLTLRGAFHTTRGARLVAADRAGRSVVFAYPDGSYAVMRDERVVFSTTSGPVTISADGDRVALARDGAIEVSRAETLFAGAARGEAA